MQNHDEEKARKRALSRADLLVRQFSDCSNMQEKMRSISALKEVEDAFSSYPAVRQFVSSQGEYETYCLGLLVLLEQFSPIMSGISSVEQPLPLIQCLVSSLIACERFYERMGGLLWYYRETLRLIEEQRNGVVSEEYHSTEYREPPFYDFRQENSYASLLEEGLKELLHTSEVYTVGGAGERLGLVDPATKEPLPVAHLNFLGRSLLEHLFRDLEAREYMYEARYQAPLYVPVILMTSEEQGNDKKIEKMLEHNGYFKRPPECVVRVIQPSVPLIDLSGNFALKGPLTLSMKPGGHGALWHLMQERGVFSWLEQKHIQHLIIRQINNPIGGIDSALLALVGVGASQKKLFGFASCPRQEGAAEGLNVLKVWQKGSYKAALSNLEYTAFDAIFKKDPEFFRRQTFFANTNLLYANVQAMKALSPEAVAPGAIVNMKSDFSLFEGGHMVRKKACRLESTMQNIADELTASFEEKRAIGRDDLPVFLNVHERIKLFSVTKRCFTSPENPLETPEYCLYDWYKMTRLLLKETGAADIPEEQTFAQFFQEGPNLTFLFHPALGPLWSHIGEKLTGLSLSPYSLLELELAEASLASFHLEGAFCIKSSFPCGVKGKPESIPRVLCSQVSVVNKGVDRPLALKEMLQGSITYREKVEFILEEGSNLHINQVEFEGPFFFHVPAYTHVCIEQERKTKELVIRSRTRIDATTS